MRPSSLSSFLVSSLYFFPFAYFFPFGEISPVVRWVQRAFHPYLVYDVQAYAEAPAFVADWGRANLTLERGQNRTVVRSVHLFNDGLDDAAFNLSWTVSKAGKGAVPIARGIQGPIALRAGFHTPLPLNVTFAVPEAFNGTLNVVFEAQRNGETVFVEDRVRIQVISVA